MNDPHVEALIYIIEHGSNVTYDDATPVAFDRPGFYVRIEDGRVRFELKEHYATAEEAQAAVQPFIDQWEFEEKLRVGSGQFALRLEKPEITDRQPTPGVFVGIPVPIRANFQMSKATGTVSRPYPQPPSEAPMDLNNFRVRRMFDQYAAYFNGRDLPVVAYICCEEFEKLGANLNDAAAKHKISHNLVKEVRKIANTKGGDGSRHAQGIGHPLTRREKQILERAVAAMIIRAAKVAADPNQHMPEINLGNLLEISP